MSSTPSKVKVADAPAGKVFLQKDLQKRLLSKEQIYDRRKLTHWGRG